MAHLTSARTIGLLLFAALLSAFAPTPARALECGAASGELLQAPPPSPAFAPTGRESRTVLAQNLRAASRVALVIGNAAYPDSQDALTQPLKDARWLATELKRLGFDVVTGENLSKQGLRTAIDNFKARIEPGAIALLYFSGYGIQLSRQSYIIPVNAEIWSEADVRRDGIGLEAILADMCDAGARAKVFILDASRRNPYEDRFRPSSTGLATLNMPTGSAVLYAMEPGKVMTDRAGENSLFMTELVRALRNPDLNVGGIFNSTRIAVSRASRFEQVPWVSSTLADDLKFDPLPSASEARREPPKASTTLSEDERLIQRYSDAIDRNADDADAFYRRGQVYARLHRFAQAVNDFTESIRLRPQDAEALNNRCWTRAALGYLQAALQDCNEALKLRPKLNNALDSRGLVYLKLGQWDRAINDYDAALRAEPKLASALYGRGKARLKKGQLAGGNGDIAEARQLDPGIEEDFAAYGIH
jgi:uncharacterized caspase-like protein